MATEWRQLTEKTYILLSGSNIGVISHEGQAVMVDCGLDKDSARKALRAVEGLEAQLLAIVITHGHADHFGGASWLAQRADVPVYAPALEGAFATHPILEPLFLYGGAAPIKELRGKFTLARRAVSTITTLSNGPQTIERFNLQIVSLPGHAPEQIGVAFEDTFYCGDVVFPKATLDRHPILFCADLDTWLETLATLPTLNYTWFAPGHGNPVQDITPLTQANTARLKEIRDLTWDALVTPQPAPAVLRAVAEHYKITFTAPQYFLLAQTTIHAALTSLQKAGEAEVVMKDNTMLWQRSN